jgi:MFS family permease
MKFVKLTGQSYYLTLYFLAVRQASPLHTGLDILPITLTLIPTSVVIGAIVTRVNSYRWAIWAGWAVTTLACGLTILWDTNTSTATWVIILMLLGFGHGFVLNAQNFATQAICLPHDEASAAAMYAFLRSFGAAIGVGIGGTVFQNVMKIKLAQFELPVEIARDAESYIVTLVSLPASPFKTHVLESYVYGVHGVYGALCGLAGVAGLLSLFIKHFDMNKELEGTHTLQEIRISRLLQTAESKRQATSIEAKEEGVEVEQSQ